VYGNWYEARGIVALTSESGQIIILNGVPRSGKSSIVAAIQETFDGLWMNLGVDTFKERITPKRYSPGIGLRPGAVRPDLEPLIVVLYAAMYESIAAHGRLGLNVVVDAGHHDAYAAPLSILADSLKIRIPRSIGRPSCYGPALYAGSGLTL
jgi:chloramphenicol 3-O phosphotransferase